MFRKCLITMVLMSIVLPYVNAQDLVLSDKYTVEAGKPYPVIDGTKHYFEAENSVICVKYDKKRWYIQKLSSLGLDQISMKTYEDMPDDIVPEYIGYFGDRLFVFYSLWDKSDEVEQLFYREVDVNAGQFKGKGERLLKVNGKVTGSLMASGFYRFQVTDKFDMLFSDDEERMLVQYSKKLDRDAIKDGEDGFTVAVFGQDLVQQWSSEMPMPYEKDKISVKDYFLDNAGKINVVARIYTGSEEKTKNREDDDYHYELLRNAGSGGAGNWEKYPLDLGTKYMMSIRLFLDGTGALRASGFYNNSKTGSTADGVFVCGFDTGYGVKDAQFHEISTEILNMYVKAREVKKNDKKEEDGDDLGFGNMNLNKIYIGDDGSMLLVGEKRYITVHCTTDSRGNTRCYNVYHADDLLISSIAAGGSLVWMKRIPKRMNSRAPIGESYTYFHSEGQHHFIHFDKDRNVDLEKEDVPSLKGKTIIMVDRINEAAGTVAREAILDVNEVKGIRLYQLATERMVRTGDAELVMEAYKKGKEDILIKITAR